MQCSEESEAVRSGALGRALGALLICLALVCVAAPAARAASTALWVADGGDAQVEEYLPGQLKHSHSPTPLTIAIGSYVYGVCFDKSKNLWVTGGDEIFGFTASELKKLPTAPSPAVTITSSSFAQTAGCTFDKQGNLWLADLNNDSLDEISAAQLNAGSASITPAVIITDTTEMSGANPGFVTFDKSGNLWTDGREVGELFEFPASELTSGGNKTAAVILMGGGSLSDPGQIGFDSKGNLWVTSYSDHTVVMFSKSQLSASNDDAPAVTISSSSLVGPWGVAFHSGDLWVLDYGDGNAQKFLKGQLKSSGAPAPKVLLTGAAIDNNWEITFGPKFGKQP